MWKIDKQNYDAMKVMFLIRSLGYGGAERQLVVLAKGLKQRGHDINVAVFYPNGALQQDLELEGIPVHVLEKQHRWDVFSFIWKLHRLVKTLDPDVLHGYMVISSLLTIILKLLGSNQNMVWGVRCSDMDRNRYDWSMRATFKLSCIASRYADLIIVNSFCGKEYHRTQKYPEHKMEVVTNGINTDKFTIDLLEGKRIRKEWGIDSEKKVIGIVARLDPMKNYEIFLAAAKQLAQLEENAKFVCVGIGPDDYQAKIRGLGANLEADGRLVWAGIRHDMEAVYNAFDIFTNCSSTEGFSNVVGEAMSCGISCVVTDVGDSARIVDSTGIIVKPGDVEGLVSAWRRLLTKSNNESKNAIRQRIIEHYSIQTLVEKTESLLLDTLV